MEFSDALALVHPFLAVALVFPAIGITAQMAWQTRQRRLELSKVDDKGKRKSKIPATVGREHVAIGRWLTGLVTGVTLVALVYVLVFKTKIWTQPVGTATFIVLMFVATLASIAMLYRTRPNQPQWRAGWTTLASAGLIILGCQDGVFRRTNEWYMSHYYFGITVSILMLASLAMLPEIYRDKTQRWRKAHIALNCLAVLLFVGQGFTGARDLLEIPLGWQRSHLSQCNWATRTCPERPTNDVSP